MRYKFSFFKKSDYDELVKLALASYQWSIPTASFSRVVFSTGLHPLFNGYKYAFENTVGIYRQEGKMAAAVWNEGNYSGDVFFLFDKKERCEETELLADMIKFAKTYSAGLKEDVRTKVVTLYIPQWNDFLKDFAVKHGFKKGTWPDETYIMPIKGKLEVHLPDGYTIIDGRDIPDNYLSMIHRLSFSYGADKNPISTDKGIEAFHELRAQKYCNDKLTLCVLDKQKRPVGMTIIWYDETMPYCEMEPLAVVWWERRKGIATALIHEAVNRILTINPNCKGITGGDQEFYKRMNFENKGGCDDYIWEAEIFISWEKESLEHNYQEYIK